MNASGATDVKPEDQAQPLLLWVIVIANYTDTLWLLATAYCKNMMVV